MEQSTSIGQITDTTAVVSTINATRGKTFAVTVDRTAFGDPSKSNLIQKRDIVDGVASIDFNLNNLTPDTAYNVYAGYVVEPNNTLENILLFFKDINYIALTAGDNTICVSNDGKLWYGAGCDILTEAGRCGLWDGNRWIIGGSGSFSLASSIDGKTWTPIKASILRDVLGITYNKNDNVYVAVGSGSFDTIMYSNDGSNWIGRGNTLLPIAKDVMTDGHVYVAVGNGIVISYDNGETWSRVKDDLIGIQEKIIWTGEYWISIGNTTINYSLDAITWITVPNTDNIISACVRSENEAIAINNTSTFSTTTNTFSNKTVINDVKYGNAISHGDEILVIGEIRKDVGRSTILYSEDNGLSWTRTQRDLNAGVFNIIYKNQYTSTVSRVCPIMQNISNVTNGIVFNIPEIPIIYDFQDMVNNSYQDTTESIRYTGLLNQSKTGITINNLDYGFVIGETFSFAYTNSPPQYILRTISVLLNGKEIGVITSSNTVNEYRTISSTFNPYQNTNITYNLDIQNSTNILEMLFSDVLNEKLSTIRNFNIDSLKENYKNNADKYLSRSLNVITLYTDIIAEFPRVYNAGVYTDGLRMDDRKLVYGDNGVTRIIMYDEASARAYSYPSIDGQLPYISPETHQKLINFYQAYAGVVETDNDVTEYINSAIEYIDKNYLDIYKNTSSYNKFNDDIVIFKAGDFSIRHRSKDSKLSIIIKNGLVSYYYNDILLVVVRQSSINSNALYTPREAFERRNYPIIQRALNISTSVLPKPIENGDILLYKAYAQSILFTEFLDDESKNNIFYFLFAKTNDIFQPTASAILKAYDFDDVTRGKILMIYKCFLFTLRSKTIQETVSNGCSLYSCIQSFKNDIKTNINLLSNRYDEYTKKLLNDLELEFIDKNNKFQKIEKSIIYLLNSDYVETLTNKIINIRTRLHSLFDVSIITNVAKLLENLEYITPLLKVYDDIMSVYFTIGNPILNSVIQTLKLGYDNPEGTGWKIIYDAAVQDGLLNGLSDDNSIVNRTVDFFKTKVTSTQPIILYPTNTLDLKTYLKNRHDILGTYMGDFTDIAIRECNPYLTILYNLNNDYDEFNLSQFIGIYTNVFTEIASFDDYIDKYTNTYLTDTFEETQIFIEQIGNTIQFTIPKGIYNGFPDVLERINNITDKYGLHIEYNTSSYRFSILTADTVVSFKIINKDLFPTALTPTETTIKTINGERNLGDVELILSQRINKSEFATLTKNRVFDLTEDPIECKIVKINHPNFTHSSYTPKLTNTDIVTSIIDLETNLKLFDNRISVTLNPITEKLEITLPKECKLYFLNEIFLGFLGYEGQVYSSGYQHVVESMPFYLNADNKIRINSKDYIIPGYGYFINDTETYDIIRGCRFDIIRNNILIKSFTIPEGYYTTSEFVSLLQNNLNSQGFSCTVTIGSISSPSGSSAFIFYISVPSDCVIRIIGCINEFGFDGEYIDNRNPYINNYVDLFYTITSKYKFILHPQYTNITLSSDIIINAGTLYFRSKFAKDTDYSETITSGTYSIIYILYKIISTIRKSDPSINSYVINDNSVTIGRVMLNNISHDKWFSVTGDDFWLVGLNSTSSSTLISTNNYLHTSKTPYIVNYSKFSYYIEHFLFLFNYIDTMRNINSYLSTYTNSSKGNIDRLFKESAILYFNDVSSRLDIFTRNIDDIAFVQKEDNCTSGQLSSKRQEFINKKSIILSYISSINTYNNIELYNNVKYIVDTMSEFETINTYFISAKEGFKLYHNTIDNTRELIISYQNSLRRENRMYNNYLSSPPPEVILYDGLGEDFIKSVLPTDSRFWTERSELSILDYAEFRPNWPYYDMDIVTYKNKVYQCTGLAIQGILPSDTRYWALYTDISASDIQGNAYNSNRRYNHYDTVTWNNSVYSCIYDFPKENLEEFIPATLLLEEESIEKSEERLQQKIQDAANRNLRADGLIEEAVRVTSGSNYPAIKNFVLEYISKVENAWYYTISNVSKLLEDIFYEIESKGETDDIFIYSETSKITKTQLLELIYDIFNTSIYNKFNVKFYPTLTMLQICDPTYVIPPTYVPYEEMPDGHYSYKVYEKYKEELMDTSNAVYDSYGSPETMIGGIKAEILYEIGIYGDTSKFYLSSYPELLKKYGCLSITEKKNNSSNVSGLYYPPSHPYIWKNITNINSYDSSKKYYLNDLMYFIPPSFDPTTGNIISSDGVDTGISESVFRGTYKCIAVNSQTGYISDIDPMNAFLGIFWKKLSKDVSNYIEFKVNNDSKSYSVNDRVLVVTDDGQENIYICIKDCSGSIDVTNTEFWMYSSSSESSLTYNNLQNYVIGDIVSVNNVRTNNIDVYKCINVDVPSYGGFDCCLLYRTTISNVSPADSSLIWQDTGNTHSFLQHRNSIQNLESHLRDNIFQGYINLNEKRIPLNVISAYSSLYDYEIGQLVSFEDTSIQQGPSVDINTLTYKGEIREPVSEITGVYYKNDAITSLHDNKTYVYDGSQWIPKFIIKVYKCVRAPLNYRFKSFYSGSFRYPEIPCYGIGPCHDLWRSKDFPRSLRYEYSLKVEHIRLEVRDKFDKLTRYLTDNSEYDFTKFQFKCPDSITLWNSFKAQFNSSRQVLKLPQPNYSVTVNHMLTNVLQTLNIIKNIVFDTRQYINTIKQNFFSQDAVQLLINDNQTKYLFVNFDEQKFVDMGFGSRDSTLEPENLRDYMIDAYRRKLIEVTQFNSFVSALSQRRNTYPERISSILQLIFSWQDEIKYNEEEINNYLGIASRIIGYHLLEKVLDASSAGIMNSDTIGTCDSIIIPLRGIEMDYSFVYGWKKVEKSTSYTILDIIHTSSEIKDLLYNEVLDLWKNYDVKPPYMSIIVVPREKNLGELFGGVLVGSAIGVLGIGEFIENPNKVRKRSFEKYRALWYNTNYTYKNSRETVPNIASFIVLNNVIRTYSAQQIIDIRNFYVNEDALRESIISRTQIVLTAAISGSFLNAIYTTQLTEIDLKIKYQYDKVIPCWTTIYVPKNPGPSPIPKIVPTELNKKIVPYDPPPKYDPPSPPPLPNDRPPVDGNRPPFDDNLTITLRDPNAPGSKVTVPKPVTPKKFARPLGGIPAYTTPGRLTKPSDKIGNAGGTRGYFNVTDNNKISQVRDRIPGSLPKDYDPVSTRRELQEIFSRRNARTPPVPTEVIPASSTTDLSTRPSSLDTLKPDLRSIALDKQVQLDEDLSNIEIEKQNARLDNETLKAIRAEVDTLPENTPQEVEAKRIRTNELVRMEGEFNVKVSVSKQKLSKISTSISGLYGKAEIGIMVATVIKSNPTPQDLAIIVGMAVVMKVVGKYVPGLGAVMTFYSAVDEIINGGWADANY